MLVDLLGLRGKAHHKRALFGARGNGGDDVRVFHQAQHVAVVTVFFLYLLIRHNRRAEIHHRGGGNKQVAVVRCAFCSGEHFIGAYHIYPIDSGGCIEAHRPGNQGDFGTGAGGSGGDGKAHLAGAVIAEISDRVECLAGGTGGNGDFLAGQNLWRGNQAHQPIHNIQRFQHPPWAHIATGLAAGVGPEQRHTAALQCVGIGPGGRVAPHGLIHGRCQHHRCLRGQAQGGEQIVRDTRGESRHHTGAGRGDQDHIGPFGQFDMPHGGLGGRVQQVGVHRVAGQRLKRQRLHERLGTGGHHHAHTGAAVLEPAYQVGAFIGGDAAGDAKQYPFVGQ